MLPHTVPSSLERFELHAHVRYVGATAVPKLLTPASACRSFWQVSENTTVPSLWSAGVFFVLALVADPPSPGGGTSASNWDTIGWPRRRHWNGRLRKKIQQVGQVEVKIRGAPFADTVNAGQAALYARRGHLTQRHTIRCKEPAGPWRHWSSGRYGYGCSDRKGRR